MKNPLYLCLSLLVPLTAVGADLRPPNIVLFLVDDLGWSDVGCFGSSFYETPNIDRLASEGVKFTSAYAACHVCSPTRASLLTGKYPARLQLSDWISGRKDYPFQKLRNAPNLQQLPLEEITLAEALKRHGYATGHYGKWHLGEESFGPLHQGFDVQVPRNWYKGWPKVSFHAPFEMDGLDAEPGDYLTDRLTDEALNFIEANRGNPFFLYLSHFAVHDPIEGRADLVQKYREKQSKILRDDRGPEFILEGNPDDSEPLSATQLSKLIEQPSHREFRVLPQRTVKIKQQQDNVEFAAMVEAMDQSLGRVIEKLEALDLAEDTIVIFFSDNGGMAAMNVGNPQRRAGREKIDDFFSGANLPLRGAKGWLYEGGIRVPCIIKWPGKSKPGGVSDEPIVSNDLYPTLLEMAGLPALPEQTLDGVSLVPLLKGKPIEREAIYWHFPHYSNHGMQSPGGAIRVGEWKLLEYFENGTVQLFNLRDDIGEQHDLAASQPDRAEELRRKLHAWRTSVGATMMAPNADYDSTKYPWTEAR
jgi:arylsulfatase A